VGFGKKKKKRKKERNGDDDDDSVLFDPLNLGIFVWILLQSFLEIEMNYSINLKNFWSRFLFNEKK